MLHGHEDAVWGLCVHGASGLLASCASDETVRLWDAQLADPLVRTVRPEQGQTSHATACMLLWYCRSR